MIALGEKVVENCSETRKIQLVDTKTVRCGKKVDEALVERGIRRQSRTAGMDL